jgi:isocitrate dehydrogenase
MYWAKELATQNDDQELKAKFAPIAKELEANIEKILEEIKSIKGKPVDIGGYYHAFPDKVKAVMRPSAILNKILATLN